MVRGCVHRVDGEVCVCVCVCVWGGCVHGGVGPEADIPPLDPYADNP